MQTLLQTLSDGIAVGSLYALIALGYTLVFGILQFINFAHGDVFALGVWISLITATWIAGLFARWQHLHWLTPGLYVLLVPVAAITACALLGFVIERLAYKPLRGAPKLNVLITAIGVSLLLENLGQTFFGTTPRLVPQLISNPVIFTAHQVNFRLIDLLVLGLALALMIGIQLLIYRTKFGTAMRAVSFNGKAAALMGINVDRIISITFVLGSALAGAAGYLYALKYQQQTMHQTADALWILLGMKAFVAAVVGGIGNVRGAMLGGLLIGLVEKFGGAMGDLGNQFGWFATKLDTNQYTDVYAFALLILVLLVRPAGILGKATVEKV